MKINNLILIFLFSSFIGCSSVKTIDSKEEYKTEIKKKSKAISTTRTNSTQSNLKKKEAKNKELGKEKKAPTKEEQKLAEEKEKEKAEQQQSSKKNYFCDQEFEESKNSFRDYVQHKNNESLNNSLNQINKALECEARLDEKLRFKVNVLLAKKDFSEIEKIAFEIPEFQYFESIEIPESVDKYKELYLCHLNELNEKCKNNINDLLIEFRNQKKETFDYYKEYLPVLSLLKNTKLNKEVKNNIEDKEIVSKLIRIGL